MIASEARPFATSGGLAEVVGSLSDAVARLGHRVTIVLPRYGRVALQTSGSARAAAGGDRRSPARSRRHEEAPAPPAPELEATLDMGGRTHAVRFFRRAVNDAVAAVFVDVPELFDREGLYGHAGGDYPDNAYRFAVFSRAALEYFRRKGDRPSVFHGHDWQTGLVPAYQKMLFSDDPVVGRVPAVFTIHNLAFQGVYPASTLAAIGLPWDVYHVQAMEYWGQISYLKAGINFSERITTVSPGYAREALAPATGCGLDGVLRRRSDEFHGILNGIDTGRWNPASDPLIPASYTADDLSGKRECKRVLLETSGLPASPESMDRPIVGLVSRMTHQKGFDLLEQVADSLMRLDATWILLGSGEARYEECWRALAARHPGRVAVTIGYDEPLEHLIEAGADLFLMPSRFEPCGLNQLNSLRYGTPPIVHATGGLDDTVEDAGEGLGGGTGFKFADYTPESLLRAVRRALDTYADRTLWGRIQRNAMARESSWDVPAREYVKVYSGIL